MSQEKSRTVTGKVADIFAHRFVIETGESRILADVGPKAAETIALKKGDTVSVTGEMKPSELKVQEIAVNGGETMQAHKAEADDGDPELALEAARQNGFTVMGEPRRKPKHYEVLGRDADGDLVELHVELDGRLRKTRQVDRSDDKWAEEMKAA